MINRNNINWPAYNKSLKQRGSITFWFSEEAISAWKPEPNGKCGGQQKYSDIAIKTVLSIRLVYKQPLRQVEGFMESIAKIMKLGIDVADYSTLSRRGSKIDISIPDKNPCDGIVIIIDSTGLKIFGAGEWSENKHGLNKRRQWRKLHLSIDESTLEIVQSSLTSNHVGDPTEALNHINKISEPIIEFIGDGAYDVKGIYTEVEQHNPENKCDVIIPPKKNAVLSKYFPKESTKRDKHLIFIKNHGRTAWECKNRYYRRLKVENAMGRYKGIIGSNLRSRTFESQKIEAILGCEILNKMTKLGTPLRVAN